MSEGSGDDSPSLSIGRKKEDLSATPSVGEGKAENLSAAPRRTSGGGDASPFLSGGKRANTSRNEYLKIYKSNYLMLAFSSWLTFSSFSNRCLKSLFDII